MPEKAELEPPVEPRPKKVSSVGLEVIFLSFPEVNDDEPTYWERL